VPRYETLLIRLDDFEMSDELLKIADEKVAIGEWNPDWLTRLLSLNMVDFREWKDREAYYKSLDNLLRNIEGSHQ
jgi:hypothetical protein